MEDKLEEVHEELLAWAESIGVEIDSIRPMRITGRGFGVVATDHIPKDTTILEVPVSALRTKDTISPSISRKFPKDMTVHGLLAADLALNHSQYTTKYAQWNAVTPTWEDIQLSLPLTWPAPLQSSLPTAAKHLLEKQRAKFEKDWSIMSEAFPLPPDKGVHSSCTRDEYLYAWLLVNTRTFYFVTPKTEKLPKEDHMVLQPVADLFNHTDQGGCHVAFGHADSFTFKTTRSYDKGDEVHISYGRHTNDFLLVEYGFVLTSNVWDEVCLDDVILPALSRWQRGELDEVGFLGNYVLDKDTVCHRTQVALRLLAVSGRYGGLSTDEWRRFVSGLDDGETSQRRVDGLLVGLLEVYEGGEIAAREKELRKMGFKGDDGNGEGEMNEARKDLLLRRWGQIRRLVEGTIERLRE